MVRQSTDGRLRALPRWQSRISPRCEGRQHSSGCHVTALASPTLNGGPFVQKAAAVRVDVPVEHVEAETPF